MIFHVPILLLLFAPICFSSSSTKEPTLFSCCGLCINLCRPPCRSSIFSPLIAQGLRWCISPCMRYHTSGFLHSRSNPVTDNIKMRTFDSRNPLVMSDTPLPHQPAAAVCLCSQYWVYFVSSPPALWDVVTPKNSALDAPVRGFHKKGMFWLSILKWMHLLGKRGRRRHHVLTLNAMSNVSEAVSGDLNSGM